MFNWLGNLFPYSDLHSLNLDWILTKMKETAAQAAKAVADAANALAQVAEAKAAALSAQTAAQNAQTAANNAATSAENAVSVAQAAKSTAQTAQSTAEAAKSAAQTAQSTAQTAQSAAETAKSTAQTAQSTAQTAQSAAETAQSAAETAQSAAETATADINGLKARFPIKSKDIATGAVSPIKLASRYAYLFDYSDSVSTINFPENGTATREELSTGVVNPTNRFLTDLNSKYLQLYMEIRESGETKPNTIFSCSAPIVTYINKSKAGLVTIAPIIVIKNETNEIYNGFIKITKISQSGKLFPECQVFFETEPPFNANTRFSISVYPVLGYVTQDP